MWRTIFRLDRQYCPYALRLYVQRHHLPQIWLLCSNL
nr:MAG TPA_asm: hypothetical protein [Caudoviricetes sp.]